MSFCINPTCTQRENPPGIDLCQACGTSLLIKDKYRLLRPLRTLDQSKQIYPSETEIFECLDTKGNPADPPNTLKIFKVLNTLEPKLKQLAKREAYALMGLYQYPNTPKVHLQDYFEYQDEHFSDTLICTAIEKIEGVDLKVWLAEHGRATTEQLKDWLGQLCEIVAVVHEKGLFHRDIKPSNIMLRPDGRLVLIDFGTVRKITNTYIAKLSGPDNKSPIQGATDVTMVRTFGYSPPEQLYGKAMPQSDFYALGRTMIHLATGIHPCNLPEDEDWVTWRDQAKDIDPDLADLIDRLCDPIPTNRPRNTAEILADLAHPPRQADPHALTQSPSSGQRWWKRLTRTHMSWFGFALGCSFMIVQVYRFVNDGQSEFTISQGLSHLTGNRPSEAENNFRQVLKDNPDNAEAHYYLALACADTQNYDCAIEHHKTAIRIAPQVWQYHFAFGSMYDDLAGLNADQNKLAEAKKLYSLAKQQYRFAHKQFSESPDPLNNLARLALLEGQSKEGVKLLQQALPLAERPTNQAAVYKNLGWAALQQKDFQAATQYLEKSRTLDPRSAATYCLLHQIKSNSKYEEACIGLPSDRIEVRQWRRGILEQIKQQQR